MSTSAKYIGAIDQGTTSSRFILFDHHGEPVCSHQVKLVNSFPQPGWQEQNPMEILAGVQECMSEVMKKFDVKDVASIGITNQRETLTVWDRDTGLPLHNSIVWCDLRTEEICHELIRTYGSRDHFRDVCGLPISTYFSAMKLRWLLENIPAVKDAFTRGKAMVGTIDTWLVYKLTGKYVTDVTNASRTMFMNLSTKQWDQAACTQLAGIDVKVLPRIISNSEVIGPITSGALTGVRVSGCIGDQQGALVGQLCFQPGNVKNTYGTGCFLLMNTGHDAVQSQHGLLTTAGFQLGKDEPLTYALEGSVAMAGASISWLTDNLELIKSPKELDALAESVPDAGGMFFVPAFSGLLSPHWRDDARGVMVGLTRFITKAHVCRATLESSAYQTMDVVNAMQEDAQRPVTALRVDGGVSRSNILCQTQSSLLGVPVSRPVMDERTALGAAIAAGLAKDIKFWKDTADVKKQLELADQKTQFQTFLPEQDPKWAQNKVLWKRALDKSFGWTAAL